MTAPAPKPEDFFLTGSEPTEHVKFLPPVRRGVRVDALVDGTAAFAAMENAIWAAAATVDLAFWIFNPATPLQSKDKGAWGARTWGDLLAAKATAGVTVRVLLTGFDPILGHDNHRQNWTAYRTMALAARGGDGGGRLQTICSLHPHVLAAETFAQGIAINMKVPATLNEHVALLNRKPKAHAHQLYASWPGLWQFVARVKDRYERRPDVALAARPVVHHQKLCIVDQTTAFLGGLDVQTGRIAEVGHGRYVHAWHDIEAQVTGAAAADVARSFVGRWNAEVPACRAFIEEANATKPAVPLPWAGAEANAKLIAREPPTAAPGAPLVTPVAGDGMVQIHRTTTAPRKGIVPAVVQGDLRAGWAQAIRQARQLVYIENQYVRSHELADWLVARAAAVPALRVILVVPVAPEEVGAGGKIDAVTQHGLALQAEVFGKLRTALKERVGIFSPLLPLPVRPGEDTGVQLHGSPQVYVHSKLLLIDDVYANISSANANLRSFYVDTEIAAAWYEPGGVRKLRLRLWREMLRADGLETWKPEDAVKKWKEIADANAREKDPKKRTGLIVPHDETKFPGAKSSFVPDEHTLLEPSQPATVALA